MRTCRQCNWDNPAHAAFCTNCGTGLEATRPPQPQLGDWTLAAGEGSLSGQLKASPVLDTPTRSMTGDEAAVSDSDEAQSADVEASVDKEADKRTMETESKNEPEVAPTLASALSNALDLNSELEATATSMPARGSAISDARTLVDWKVPHQAGEGASQDEVPVASEATADEVSEKSDVPDAQPEKPESTGSFVSMAKPSEAKGDEDETAVLERSMSEVSRLSSKAPGLINPPADIAATTTIDFDGSDEPPIIGRDEPMMSGSTSASADFMAAGGESVDIPIESLDGDDSLAGLSHSLMRRTISAAMGPGDMEEPEELASVDLQSVDAVAHGLPKMAEPAPVPEIRTPVGAARYVLRQLGSTEKGHRSLTLSSDGLVIGRSEGEVIIDHDPFISPRHASLSIHDGEVEATDLGSLNGVWVRARREARLTVGDQVMLGEQIFKIEEMAAETAQVKDGSGTRRMGTRLRRSAFGIVLVGWDGLAVGRWVIPEHGCRVGRHAGELVFNDDQLLSATHGLFVPRSDGVVLKDLESANGCWVRARNQVRLAVGDAVMVGRTVWRVGLAGTTRTSTGPA